MGVEIRPVGARGGLREFVNLPYRLHRGTRWIPPLKLERYAYLNRKLNPFFKHGDAQYFLAWRDGRVVGRISAQIDHNFNEFHGNRWGFYGFFEFEDDQEVVDALLAAAQDWLRERGADRMIGPYDFIINEECGILIEGFELEPMIRQPWQPPYYQQRVEAAGLIKAMDVLHWHLELENRNGKMDPRLPRVAERAREKQGVTIRKMSFWRLGRDLKEFVKIYNAAWSHNWGFSPYDDHDAADLSINYRLIFDKPWFMLAEKDGQVIGAAITIPDINQVLKRMNGRVLPLGWWYYLRKKRIIDRCRVGFLGVLPEFQHTGTGVALYIENFDVSAGSKIKWGEAGWILENNTAMNHGLEAMGGHIVKRARIYERLLEEGAQPAAVPAPHDVPH